MQCNRLIRRAVLQLSGPESKEETRVHQTQAASDSCIVQQRAADADSKSDAEASVVPVGR